MVQRFRAIVAGTKILDYILLALSALVFIAFSLSMWAESGQGAQVRIETPSGVYLFDLNQDKTFSLTGSSGQSSFTIKNGSVSFIDSPCRDKLCVKRGLLSQGGQWSACLPNRMFAKVESSKATDLQGTDVQSY